MALTSIYRAGPKPLPQLKPEEWKSGADRKAAVDGYLAAFETVSEPKKRLAGIEALFEAERQFALGRRSQESPFCDPILSRHLNPVRQGLRFGAYLIGAIIISYIIYKAVNFWTAKMTDHLRHSLNYLSTVIGIKVASYAGIVPVVLPALIMGMMGISDIHKKKRGIMDKNVCQLIEGKEVTLVDGSRHRSSHAHIHLAQERNQLREALEQGKQAEYEAALEQAREEGERRAWAEIQARRKQSDREHEARMSQLVQEANKASAQAKKALGITEENERRASANQTAQTPSAQAIPTASTALTAPIAPAVPTAALTTPLTPTASPASVPQLRIAQVKPDLQTLSHAATPTAPPRASRCHQPTPVIDSEFDGLSEVEAQREVVAAQEAADALAQGRRHQQTRSTAAPVVEEFGESTGLHTTGTSMRGAH